MRKISKEFPGVRALDEVSFTVQPSEIHALCGENGAGKSTLMKILAGFYPYPTYSGEILINGQVCQFGQIRDSEHSGIAIIHQELSVLQEMTVGENVFIGREPNRFGVIEWNRLYSKTQALLDKIGLKVNPRAKIKDLGIGQRQLVEIAKALSQNPRILVLDEPTSALSQAEIQILMKLLLQLKQEGVSSIMISHKLGEVMEVADRITVLRDGRSVITYGKEHTSEQRIISDMVGRELKELFPRVPRNAGKVVFEVKNLSVGDPLVPGRLRVKNFSFEVRESEILGISGLMGAGRTELLMSLFGAFPGTRTGQILVEGRELNIDTPRDAISAGLALVTEDRKEFGLLLEESVLKNMTLSSLSKIASAGIVSRTREAALGIQYKKNLRVKTPSLETIVKNLSGGNQQKVVLAKCLMTQPKVLFLDEPTRGIDVGAKAEIYKLMNELASQGMAIVMVSSELPEILGMSDRVLVMSEGKLTAELKAEEASQERIMAAATGARVAACV